MLTYGDNLSDLSLIFALDSTSSNFRDGFVELTLRTSGLYIKLTVTCLYFYVKATQIWLYLFWFTTEEADCNANVIPVLLCLCKAV